MRVAAVLALACSAAVARADALSDAQEWVADAASSVSSAAEEATSTVSSVVESVSESIFYRPTFTPTTNIKAPFFEQFLDDSRWQASNAKKENTEEEWAFVGEWKVEEPTVFRGLDGDKGLVLKNKAAHHAISSKFAKPISNKDDTLVVQYEVKLQNGLECGGAYMKLLQDNKNLHATEFSNASPYVIMFGPDKCGSTNKVHFIFRHKNPKTGVYEEKHLKAAPPARITKTSTLYTLIVKPDQTFEILINGESSKKGSLLEDFTPPVNPEKEIDDPKDSKPSDWVDEAKIADPAATKPDDWDEDAPYQIVDEDAVKPDDWLEDEPLMVPDPEAQKPEDWDDEEDGDWIPPMISNPKGNDVSGVGPWEKPMINNPAFKGKWTAPMIDNPLYKGEWAPRKIANPDFFEDKKPANFEPMGAIGFELWTMQNDILFDNIYIGHSIADALTLQKETFDIKVASEKTQEEAEKPKKEDLPPAPSDLKFLDDPVTFMKEKFDLFVKIAQHDPLGAVKKVPEMASAIGIALVTIIVALGTALGGAAPSKEQVKAKAKEAKESAEKAKDQVAEAVASGAEKAKDEVNKRTTRSAKAE